MNRGVSVVVPTFNSGTFVEATIASILAQTHADFELIVADHCSTDDTWDRLQRFSGDSRVRLLRTPAGGGAPANWRRVAAEARGEYLKLVCGDDLIAPTCLAEQVAVLDAEESVVLVSCLRRLIDADGKVVIAARGLGGLVGTVPGHLAVRRAVLRGTNIFGEPGCVLLRRRTFLEAGGWDDSEPFVIDQATFSNVALLGDVFALPRPLATFRLSPAQWSVDLGSEQSDQVVAFHHRLAASHPGLLSRTDLMRGDSMARAAAQVRRLTYRWLGHGPHRR